MEQENQSGELLKLLFSILPLWPLQRNINHNIGGAPVGDRKKSLYQISEQLFSLTQDLSLNQGEINEEQEQLFELLQLELSTKVDGVIDYIKYQKSYIEEIKQRRKELQELEQVEQNKLDRFKTNVVKCMNLMQEPKLKGKFGLISLRKPSKKLVINDEKSIPIEFIEMTPKILKSELKKAIEQGETIDGVSIVSGDQSILVK